MLKNVKKADRNERLFEVTNGLAEPTNGEIWELFLCKVYNASRYYPTVPASRSGDLVAKGIHYQAKAANGIWEGITNLKEFENFITKIDKASKYLLRVGTDPTLNSRIWWLEVDKQELIKLAKLGFVKFDRLAYGKPAAKWTITQKKAYKIKKQYNLIRYQD